MVSAGEYGTPRRGPAARPVLGGSPPSPRKVRAIQGGRAQRLKGSPPGPDRRPPAKPCPLTWRAHPPHRSAFRRRSSGAPYLPSESTHPPCTAACRYHRHWLRRRGADRDRRLRYPARAGPRGHHGEARRVRPALPRGRPARGLRDAGQGGPYRRAATRGQGLRRLAEWCSRWSRRARDWHRRTPEPPRGTRQVLATAARRRSRPSLRCQDLCTSSANSPT